MVLNDAHDDHAGLRYCLVPEVCDRLHVSPWTVYRRIADGRLRAVRPANRWLVLREDVERMLSPSR
jgi:excisionase family DNA binding protein